MISANLGGAVIGVIVGLNTSSFSGMAILCPIPHTSVELALLVP